MHDHRTRTEQRLVRFLREQLEPALVIDRAPLQVQMWQAPGEPVEFGVATAQRYEPVEQGRPWGRPWGTVWFHLTGEVPRRWERREGVRVEATFDLGFARGLTGFQCEATVYTPDGQIIKGIEPDNRWIPINGDRVDVWVEASANPTIAYGNWATPTPLGDLATAGEQPLYVLGEAVIVQIDECAEGLARDIEVLLELWRELPVDSTRAAHLTAGLDDMLGAVDFQDVHGSLPVARQTLQPLLDSPANATSHEAHAVGHAHIDSAWLWPLRETRRKCARTFSNVLALMDIDPEFTFCCSSAQQYAWIEQDHPELFARIAARVAEGRFIPVGGMWVEADANLPSGESLVRQFLHGTTYFMEKFGVEPVEVWLPDSFGYTAAWPQIAQGAGKRFFLTQKLSWNDTNRFPHHTFWWEGIDGTRIFTHFPPVDTYTAELRGAELAKAERQFAEKGRATKSLVPYGYGDGGGGPTREMTQRAHRLASLEGSPRVKLSTSQQFFAEALDEYPGAPVWRGELYLEYHRGTLTSQHRTKEGNRRNESLLAEAELWSATAAIQRDSVYPYEELASLWRDLLLLQFHDILPGSSIAWVHHQAEQMHAEITSRSQTLIQRALATLAGQGDIRLIANPAPFPAGGIPPLSISAEPEPHNRRPVELAGDGALITVTGGSLRVQVAENGQLDAMIDLETGRDHVAAGCGQLMLHPDIPNRWDAWDIEGFYRDRGRPMSSTVVHREEGQVLVEHQIGQSTIRQTIRPHELGVHISFDIDWQEQQQLLKWYLPLAINSDKATSEIQFGHLSRSTHANTSWDEARFETAAQRWVHVGEGERGIFIANAATYGWGIHADRDQGGPITRIGASLVRGPKFPDPAADIGHHQLDFLIGSGTVADAIRAGLVLSRPTRVIHGGGAPADPLVSVDDPLVVTETVKLAEDRSGDVVIRLYESTGQQRTATLTLGSQFATAVRTDLLERPLEELPLINGSNLRVQLRAFEITTLRLAR
ncbi:MULTISPECIES: alpha-mannosidase [unclassified Luteococcus]|uniref:alpha-mannosidase n=1 Tax=unclassified Luteococcus TaxID=2639923 RepID=UPI00313F1447